MRDKKVTITDNVIHYENNNRNIVMHRGSKDITEMYSRIVCQNKGRVLDIGFGMGFSADKMYELADEYHCIEINPQIYEKMMEWAKDKPNVTIWFGDWKELIPTFTQKFDGIFMDTHDDPNYNEFEQYASLIANEGCILSIFNYFTTRTQDEMNGMDFQMDITKFPILVESDHRINWTVFRDGEFKEDKNSIFKSVQTKLI